MASQRSSALAREKAQQPDGIEMSIVHKSDSMPVKVRIDGGVEVSFTGTVWSRLDVMPGLHTVHVTTTASGAQTIQRIVELPEGGVGRLEGSLS